MSRHRSQSPVLPLVALIGLCAACVSVARAQDYPAPDPQPTPYLSLEGQPPNYRPYASLDYFLWHDGAGWHLRATTSGHYHSFSGSIRAEEGLSDVRPMDPSVSLQIGQNQIGFAFTVAGGEKGFDWQSPGPGCAQYKLLVDGQDRPGKVTVGSSEGHPNYGGFQLCAGGEAAPLEVAAATGPEVDPDQFRPALSPYGQWVDVPDYGLVWRPYPSVVGADFTPYGTEGHWVYTNAGWLWSSGYSWGWAPFHYGNWVYAGGGWAWIPGRVWAPAWVQWRSGGGYTGWAPMGPAGVVVVRAPVTYVYVQNNNFTAVNVHEHVVTGVQAQTIYAQTQPLPSAQVVNGHPVAPVNAGPQPGVILPGDGPPGERGAGAHGLSERATRDHSRRALCGRGDCRASRGGGATPPCYCQGVRGGDKGEWGPSSGLDPARGARRSCLHAGLQPTGEPLRGSGCTHAGAYCRPGGCRRGRAPGAAVGASCPAVRTHGPSTRAHGRAGAHDATCATRGCGSSDDGPAHHHEAEAAAQRKEVGASKIPHAMPRGAVRLHPTVWVRWGARAGC